MALGRKTGGRDFKKGETHNPFGRPPVPYEIRELRKHTRAEIELAFSKYMRMNRVQLEAVFQSPLTPALDGMVVAVIANVLKSGDPFRLDFLLNRVIGPAPKNLPPESDTPSINTFTEFVRLAKERASNGA